MLSSINFLSIIQCVFNNLHIKLNSEFQQRALFSNKFTWFLGGVFPKRPIIKKALFLRMEVCAGIGGATETRVPSQDRGSAARPAPSVERPLSPGGFGPSELRWDTGQRSRESTSQAQPRGPQEDLGKKIEALNSFWVSLLKTAIQTIKIQEF